MQGLFALRELRPEIVFLDMQMPMMNVMEFLEKAQGDLEKCAIIVISGYDDFCYTRSAVRHGAVDYLLKPVAGRVGYSDTNYFSKAFRNYAGKSPKEWRHCGG